MDYMNPTAKQINKKIIFLCFLIHSTALIPAGEAMDLFDFLPSFSHDQTNSLLLKKVISQKISSPRLLSQEEVSKKLGKIIEILPRENLEKKDVGRLLELYKEYYQKLKTPSSAFVMPYVLKNQYEMILGWNHSDITICPDIWSPEDLEKVFNNPLIADESTKGAFQELSLVIKESSSIPSWNEAYNEKLVDFFKNSNSSIVDFYLTSASLSKAHMEQLTSGLSFNTQITHLSLPCNAIGDEGAISLAAYLKTNKTLQYLNLSDNGIGNNGLVAIAKALKENRTLKTLILGDKETTTPNIFTESGLRMLSDALKDNHSLECLYLNYIRTNTAGAKQISSLIQNNTLSKISLSHCAIGHEGAVEIAKGLSMNKSLRYLSLNDNQIGEEGGILIGKALMNQKNPLVLKLKGNNIEDQGAMQIAEVLKSHTMIWKLNLSDNNIGNSGAKALLEGVSTASREYFYLNLQKNDIDSEVKKYSKRLAAKKMNPCLFWVDF